MHFQQTYINDALWDRGEWGQKVRVELALGGQSIEYLMYGVELDLVV